MPSDEFGERTEDPTPKRRQDARRSGNVARSQELGSALMLVAATVIVGFALYPLLERFKTLMQAVLAGDTLGSPNDPGHAMTVVEYVAVAGARMLLPLLLITAAVGIIVNYLQVGWLFAPQALAPSLSKLDPVAGAKRLFSLNSFFKAGLSVVKIGVIGVVVFLTVVQYRDRILVLAYLSPMQSLNRIGVMMLDLAARVLAVLLLLGVIDFIYRKWKHKEDLKMTKQQVKDEMKSAEGDPKVKRRRMRMAQEIAMQRVAAAVPKADVVVTNPEHVAVAIRYDAERMNAPRVVARGADFVALRIRQIALVNGIPILERPPLARALYRQVGVGQEIPPEFYQAIAEVLAYVYGLEQRAAG